MANQAVRFGAQKKVIRAIRSTAIFTAMSVTILRRNISGPARNITFGVSPGLNIIASPVAAERRNYTTDLPPNSATQAHAEHFINERRAQMAKACEFNSEPIVVTPFDAELFGHWWFEGPRFLDLVIRKIAADRSDFALTTPSEYLKTHPKQQVIAPAASSWGDKGYFEVWLDKSNSWIYSHLHAAARRMVETARAHERDMTPHADRVLKQLARELLLAQSSDWAFLMKTGTAREYATQRTHDHILRFNRLYEQFIARSVDENFLSECEERDNLFPNVNWRYYI